MCAVAWPKSALPSEDACGPHRQRVTRGQATSTTMLRPDWSPGDALDLGTYNSNTVKTKVQSWIVHVKNLLMVNNENKQGLQSLLSRTHARRRSARHQINYIACPCLRLIAPSGCSRPTFSHQHQSSRTRRLCNASGRWLCMARMLTSASGCESCCSGYCHCAVNVSALSSVTTEASKSGLHSRHIKLVRTHNLGRSGAARSRQQHRTARRGAGIASNRWPVR